MRLQWLFDHRADLPDSDAQDRLARLVGLDEHKEREATLRNTLLTAQRVSEEIKENARKEAEVVLKQAEIQGDRWLELAQSRAHEVERSILDLHNSREVLRSDVRALVTQLSRVLDLQEEGEQDQALHFLKRRGSSP